MGRSDAEPEQHFTLSGQGEERAPIFIEELPTEVHISSEVLELNVKLSANPLANIDWRINGRFIADVLGQRANSYRIVTE